MAEWKDVTSWSNKDTDKSEPRTVSLKLGRMLIVVTRNINFAKTDWIIQAEPFFHDAVLKAQSLSDAKSEALDLIETELETALNALIAKQTA